MTNYLVVKRRVRGRIDVLLPNLSTDTGTVEDSWYGTKNSNLAPPTYKDRALPQC